MIDLHGPELGLAQGLLFGGYLKVIEWAFRPARAAWPIHRSPQGTYGLARLSSLERLLHLAFRTHSEKR